MPLEWGGRLFFFSFFPVLAYTYKRWANSGGKDAILLISVLGQILFCYYCFDWINYLCNIQFILWIIKILFFKSNYGDSWYKRLGRFFYYLLSFEKFFDYYVVPSLIVVISLKGYPDISHLNDITEALLCYRCYFITVFIFFHTHLLVGYYYILFYKKILNISCTQIQTTAYNKYCSMDTQSKCPICFNKFQWNSSNFFHKICIIGCGHIFHCHCLIKYRFKKRKKSQFFKLNLVQCCVCRYDHKDLFIWNIPVCKINDFNCHDLVHINEMDMDRLVFTSSYSQIRNNPSLKKAYYNLLKQNIEYVIDTEEDEKQINAAFKQIKAQAKWAKFTIEIAQIAKLFKKKKKVDQGLVVDGSVINQTAATKST